MTTNTIYPSLNNKTVLITGGGSGIGAALTTAFVRQGATVAFIDIDTLASEQLIESLRTENSDHRVEFHRCDIRDIASLQTTIADINAALGPITALVNNAANDDRHDWRDVTPEYWDERMAINLRPQFFTIQAVAPAMIDAGGGSIINFGSVSWQKAQGYMPGYTTAKAAVHGLSRTMARDLGEANIRVNTVVPGAVITQRQLDNWIGPDDEAQIQSQQCLKKRLLPEHLAPMALFLAADESAGCTAQEFIVDGGVV
ncbi:SDR family oxidoreductase [Salinisphaera sp. USBA-960]|uniref:SDR family NAD(P)-dependent oxidoreductase n=1 Tax=Salinisphaera orenii TaxID=856731 RepID=UPI000DBE4B07|nr:SDR family oxidoreductase [Salifodinibacter halophilus]NNC25824.1 SDR family oxidoreductase [Salifodinibacter halophilus]